MRTGTLPVTAILAAAVGMGTAGDFLLRGPGEPGLNVVLLFAGLAASVCSVALKGGPHLSREAVVWMATGVLLGTGLMWRGSELLRFLAFMSAAAALALPALHAGGAWVRQGGVADVLEAVAASGLHAVLGSARLLQGAQWEVERTDESHRTTRSAARSVLGGALTAALPVSVFGALFLSADPVFAGILGDFVRIDLASFASHLVVVAILSWLACGYLAGFSSGTRLDGLRTLGWEPPTLRRGEVAVALGLVDLLFLGFVVVQFRYLFGGAAMVEVTPGMTYAAYAREGFFQLLAATALGLPWLLVADRLLGDREESAGWTYRALAGAQLLLLLAIVASALQRMRAYLDAYGLTEDRFVATAVLLWLTLLVVWFGATVLRGRRDPFALGVLVSGFGLILLLQLSNPTAYAARSHLNRAQAALHQVSEPGSRLDVTYLSGLGSDAVPVLVGRMGELTEAARCEVATALLSRWGPDRESDWRNWNLADWRARQLVKTEGARLRAMAEEGGGCG
jgi:hypothetical protein